jgi:hypothetical protein
VLAPSERDQTVEFLSAAFHLPKTAPFLNPPLLEWKYDLPRPDFKGSRSFAWMDGSEIAAHACVCPLTYRIGGQRISASYLIDWASGRRSPGAGVLLLRKISKMFSTLLAIGGSTDTQEILPKLGYKAGGELEVYARVIRPWRQFRTDPFSRGWKAPLRLARNLIWSSSRVPSVRAGWSCTVINRFDSSHAVLFEAEPPYPASARTVELMNYLLACPGAKMSAYLIDHEGERLGWFVLSRVAGVLRIAELRLRSSDPAHWQAAFTLATRTALADPYACELIAAASIPVTAEALRYNGFRLRRTDPIFLLDLNGLLLGNAPFEVSLLDSDAAYLYSPEYPYMT